MTSIYVVMIMLFQARMMIILVSQTRKQWYRPLKWCRSGNTIDTNKALLLDELDLDPDALLTKIEEFEGISQATEHSYPALILSSEDGTSSSIQVYEDVPQNGPYSEYEEVYSDNEDDYVHDDDTDDDALYDSDSVPPGSLPIDVIAEKLDHD